MAPNFLNKIFRKKEREVFYCKALQGQSSYNICINCDMTVSCNCQDYDGSGHIGDLRTHSFEEIFRSGQAQRFREILARGEYPVPLCPYCCELQAVRKSELDRYITEFDLPRKGIMVENTILCNLQCRFCDRVKTQKIRSQTRMSLSDMESVAKIIRDIGIAEISFFSLGESCLSDRFHLEIDLLRKYNPDLRIYLSTNGALMDSPEKIRAAMELHHILFSIDGPSQDILVKYQVGGNFDKSYGNMRKVIDERDRLGKKTPTVEWKYVVFNWNDKNEHINKAIELAKGAGVDLISFMRGGAPSRFRSKRYKSSAFFRNLGQPSWRGREIWFEYKDAP